MIHTHTYVTVPVTVGVLAQVAAILEEAGWADAVERDSGNNITLIDMHGLALTPLNRHETDFDVTAHNLFELQFLLTPRTPQAFEWLEKQYPKESTFYFGESFLISGKGWQPMLVMARIYHDGLTVNIKPV